MKKSYYAVIPANVRYDEKLPMGARMLYGELTALANEKGYCWATNSYFAELYNVTTTTISNWITKLEKQGHIHREIIYKKGSKEIEERRIYITPIKNNFNTPIKENFNTPIKNLGEGIKENFNTPIKENFKENNTLLNITSNTTSNIELQKNCNDKDNLKFKEDSTEIALARFMRNELLRIKPNSRVPNTDARSLQNWAQHIDYMIRLDKREPKEIAELFRWAQEDEFWCANVRSPRKLREKWDTLELQKDRDKPKGNKNLSKLEEMYRKALEEEEGE